MDVPTFCGGFLNWLSFKDLFQASVIKIFSLSNVEKLQLLKLHVSGEAAKFLKTIQIADANFEFAWNIHSRISILVCDGLVYVSARYTGSDL